MIEMYAFIAAFTAQIFIFSVLGPIRVIGGLREQIKRFIAEHAPAVDPLVAAQVDRRLQHLGRFGLGTAVVGLLLVAAMIRYMLRPDWTDGPLEVVTPFYFLLQVLPTFLAVVTAGGFHAVLKRSLPQAKRKALLQPRGLFDFVSRSAVAAAIVAYVLYIALLMYVERHPFPGFAGLTINAAMVTLTYALMGLAIFVILRTMGSSPLQGREDRMRSVGTAVKVVTYSCIVFIANLSLNMTLILLDQQRWEPAFGCIGIIVVGLLMRSAAREQLRIPEPAAPTLALVR